MYDCQDRSNWKYWNRVRVKLIERVSRHHSAHCAWRVRRTAKQQYANGFCKFETDETFPFYRDPSSSMPSSLPRRRTTVPVYASCLPATPAYCAGSLVPGSIDSPNTHHWGAFSGSHRVYSPLWDALSFSYHSTIPFPIPFNSSPAPQKHPFPVLPLLAPCWYNYYYNSIA